MNRYSNPNSNIKPCTRASSQRTTQKDQLPAKQSLSVNFYSKQKGPSSNLNPRQFFSENKSERKLPYHIISADQRKKSPFNKQKIFRSYSEAKNKLSSAVSSSANDEFLIRVPKNQNLIQNYIQQLKELKKRISSEKETVQQYHKQKLQKKEDFSLKVPEQKVQNYSLKQQNKHVKKINEQSNTRSDQNKIFSRDMKKHMKKLKIFKDFVDENDNQLNADYQTATIFSKHKSSTKPTYQSPLKEVNEQQVIEYTSIYQSQPKFSQAVPSGIIYGDIINVKQEFKIGSLASDKKFNRYSSESGRKLVAVSKSLNLKQKQRIRTEQKIERYNNSRSLVLKRRKTQETDKKESGKRQPVKDEPQKEQASVKDSLKPKVLRRQHQGLTSEQQQPSAMKSIQGYSTIEAKKQTIDILGESCMEIKENLMQSNKKMDHILDMLGYDLNELKEQTQRDKRRKISYERFSKAFPKGFFNN